MSNIDMGKIAITDEGTYEINKNYEKLSIVKDGSGGVYLSRKDTNGASLHNRDYWTTILNGETPIVFDTIDDMINYDGDTITCIVRDKDRGGIFIYDSYKSDENNGGTVFNGWVRQFDGAVNIKWFGAVGDGDTDDTDAIQKAITFHNYIYIPKGNFLLGDVLYNDDIVNQALLINKDNVIIYGEGEESRLIAPYPNGSSGLLSARYIFKIVGDNIKLDSLHLDGNQHTDANGNVIEGGKRSAEIVLESSNNIKILNCFFSNSASQPINVFDNVHHLVVDKCFFNVFFEAVVYIKTSSYVSSNITISNCKAYSGTGILPSSLAVNQKGNLIGIELGGNRLENLYILNNTCYVSGTCISVGSPSNLINAIIKNNIIKQYTNSYNVGITGDATGIRLANLCYIDNDTNNTRECKIEVVGNIIENFTANAVLVSSAAEVHSVLISDNIIKNCRSVDGYTDSLIKIDNTQQVKIYNNQFLNGLTDSSKSVRYVESNSDYISIINNYLDHRATFSCDINLFGTRSLLSEGLTNTSVLINSNSNLKICGKVVAGVDASSSNITINIDYPEYYEELIIYIVGAGNDVTIQLPNWASVFNQCNNGGNIKSDGDSNNAGDFIILKRLKYHTFIVTNKSGDWTFNDA